MLPTRSGRPFAGSNAASASAPCPFAGGAKLGPSREAWRLAGGAMSWARTECGGDFERGTPSLPCRCTGRQASALCVRLQGESCMVTCQHRGAAGGCATPFEGRRRDRSVAAGRGDALRMPTRRAAGARSCASRCHTAPLRPHGHRQTVILVRTSAAHAADRRPSRSERGEEFSCNVQARAVPHLQEPAVTP